MQLFKRVAVLALTLALTISHAGGSAAQDEPERQSAENSSHIVTLLRTGESYGYQGNEEFPIVSDRPTLKVHLLNGQPLIPIRFLERFGAEIKWEADTRTAVLVLSGNEYRFALDGLGNKQGATLSLPAETRIIDQSIYIPLPWAASRMETKLLSLPHGVIAMGENEAIARLSSDSEEKDKAVLLFQRFIVFQNEVQKATFRTWEEALSYASSLARAKIVENFSGTKKWDNYLPFAVFQGNTFLKETRTKEEAIAYARKVANSTVTKAFETRPVFRNGKRYLVYQGEYVIKDSLKFSEALAYAKSYKNSSVQSRDHLHVIWSWNEKMGTSKRLNAPYLSQLPELPRGCEVTTLAMMLRHAGVNVDKMTLARQIKKVPYKHNPYDGFVGNMYTFSQPGYGVYHPPVEELANRYLPGRILNLSGTSFQDVLSFVHKGTPVWVIVNTRFKALPAQSFQTWKTPTGNVQITWSEHSVLITGYDSQYVYVHDPLVSYGKNRKLLRKDFQAAWEQMGRQAITYFVPKKS